MHCHAANAIRNIILGRIAFRTEARQLRAVLCAALLIAVAASWTTVCTAAPEAPLNHPTTLSSHSFPDFADLVAQVKPAVVSITSRLQIGSTGSDQEEDRGQALPFPFNQFPFNLMVPRL